MKYQIHSNDSVLQPSCGSVNVGHPRAEEEQRREAFSGARPRDHGDSHFAGAPMPRVLGE